MNHHVVMIDDEEDIYLFQDVLKALYPTIELGWYLSIPAFFEAYPFIPKPHLILLDNGLPGQIEVEWLQTFLAHPCCQDIPVVILTGGESVQYREFAEQFGAANYLVKPDSREDLQQLVVSIVHTWLFIQ